MRKINSTVKLFLNLISSAALVAALTNCSAATGGSNSYPYAVGLGTSGLTNATIPTSGANVMQIRVGTCGPYGYTNEVCTAVTICAPGTSGADGSTPSSTTCQTIDNILVDTGSVGLRIFQSLITVSLTPVSLGGGAQLGTCVNYLNAPSQWGMVEKADIILGTERALSVPMQVISSSAPPTSASCANSLTSPETAASPADAHFNGVLGVGVFAQDCGLACQNDSNNNDYFSCSGGTCTRTTANSTLSPLQQVTNPVTLLDTLDKNGIIMMLPSLQPGGDPAVTGALVLGIGTEANNTTGSAVAYTASSQATTLAQLQMDTEGEFSTTYIGTPYTNSFIDSGSNGLYFPATSNALPPCGDGFYCPSNITTLNAIQQGHNGNSVTTFFRVISANYVGSNGAYDDLAGAGSGYFDWGLPFFFGRAVYIGIQGGTAETFSGVSASGPYWAY